MRGQRGPAVLVALGGIGLLIAMSAGWVTSEAGPNVGGLVVEEAVSTPGIRYAPGVLPVALVSLGLAAILAVVKGAVRRVVGVLAVCAGGVAGVLIWFGLLRLQGDGATTPAPLVAMAAAGAVCVGGIFAVLKPAQRPATGRYEVPSEQQPDDEWEIASGEQD